MSNYVDKFLEILGKKRVSTNARTIKKYVGSGVSDEKTPKAVVKPLSTEDVRQIIELAKAEHLNLVTVSSAGAVISIDEDSGDTGDTIILDMSRMNKIVLVDRRNKAALIEPGVTFSQLNEEVEKVGLKVLMPLLPAEEKSVIGSYLEREPIQIPKYHWDMTDPLLCTEVVFGTGEVFRTGSAAGPGTLEQQRSVGVAQVNPLGPGQCDLLRVVQGSQGTMGVVSWATVKLEVLPQIHLIQFVPNGDLDRLVDFAYKVLRRKLCDEFFILNAQSMATVINSASGGEVQQVSVQAPYTLVLGISGYEYYPEERVAYQEADLAKLAQESGVETVKHVPGCSGREMAKILATTPSGNSYKASAKGDHLDIFFLTTLDKAKSFIGLMEQEAEKHGMSMGEIGTYIQPIQHGRTAHVEFTIHYDATNDEEKEQAELLFASASEVLMANGAFFSRPYGIWSRLAYAKCEDTVQVLKKTKQILDPDGVLNQGKLCFQEVA